VASTGEQETGGRKGRRRKGRANALVELVVIVAVALGLALAIQQWLVKPYRIPSESMVPTLAVGQRVLVDRLTNNWSSPSRGDVVVFHPPAGADDTNLASPCGASHSSDQACPSPTSQRSSSNFIKRVVAVGGDTIAVVNNRVILNGKPVKEPFINPSSSCSTDETICNLRQPITVPKGDFFMMGDNRGESSDSRVWGPVPKSWIIGEAFFTYWPPDRIGTL
jgi:signal peptidase I